MGSAPHSRARWLPHPALLAAASIYLITRLLVLYTNFDQVALPAYELFPAGTLARNVYGPKSALPFFYCYDNSLGPPAISYLGAASFKLFGTSYLALKLVAFAVMFPCLFLIWGFLRRHFGVGAAAVGALLYALPPTTLFQYTLLPVGNHAENVTLTMLAVWAFLRVHRANGGAQGGAGGAWRSSVGGLLLAGLAAGLALSIFLGALVPVVLLIGLHAGLVGWRRALRELPIALAGFAVGLVPLVSANTLAGGARGLSFLTEKFKGSTEAEAFDWGAFGDRLELFFTVYLPRAGTSRDFLGVAGDVADLVFLGAFLAAALLSLPAALRGLVELVRGLVGRGALELGGAAALRRAILVPLYVYLPLTGVAFALSDLRMGDHAWPMESAGYRYFLPHFLFAILLIALTAARLGSARALGARTLGVSLGGAAVFTGLFVLELVDLDGPAKGAGAHYPGYNVKQTARTLFLPQNELVVQTPDGPRVDYATLVEIAESYPPRLREQVYFGFGFYEPYLLDLQRFPPALEPSAVLAPYPAWRRPDLARGLGANMRQRQLSPGELPQSSWDTLARYVAEGEPLRERFAEGLCTRWSPLLAMDTPEHVETNLVLTIRTFERVRPLASAVARGFGHDSGRLVALGMPYQIELVRAARQRLPGPLQRPFFVGLGMGLADGAERPAIPERVDAWVPPEHRADVLRGFSDRMTEVFGGDARAALERAPVPAAWR